MKHRTALIRTSLMLALAAAASAANSADTGRGSTALFEQIEKSWARALVTADRIGLDRYEAPEYIMVAANGATLSKAQADGEILNGNQHFESLEIEVTDVRRSGNLAVVTGHARTKESYRGQDSSGEYKFTDVFVVRAGQWMAVHAQLTRVAAAAS